VPNFRQLAGLCGWRQALPRLGAALEDADAGDSLSFPEQCRTGAGRLHLVNCKKE
jgi:hypothetical protein